MFLSFELSSQQERRSRIVLTAFSIKIEKKGNTEQESSLVDVKNREYGNGKLFLSIFYGSFVCFFLSIGKFKEQATSNSAWLPVLNSKVPEPRPGTCVNDTASLPDSVLNFIRSHPLMDRAVNHEHNNPVFYKRDLVFTKLVVDK